MNQYGFDVISTHTLTWSVKNAKEVKDLALNFNSHAHVERDEVMDSRGYSVVNFNSHAHVERDLVLYLSMYLMINFNSHAHVERDTCELPLGKYSYISTHTLTWSVTLDVVYIWCLLNVMRTYFFI